MKLGFGTTVLEQGINNGHMDGIGVYANNLWKNFSGKLEMLQPISFGRKFSDKAEQYLGTIRRLNIPYNYLNGFSVITDATFIGDKKITKDIDIFFAPDHHIPKLKNVPVVAAIMDAIPAAHPEYISMNLRKLKIVAFKRSSFWAEHIITISEHSKQDIVKYFKIPEEKISVVPLGVDTAYFRKIPEKQKKQILDKYEIDREFFIFVGTIQPRKNLMRMIEVYESLPEKVRNKYQLVIIGQYGWGSKDFLEKIKNLKDQGSVKWLQNISDEDLHALYQSAFAMLYPSLYEGFGIPPLEAMASEIPVIASNTTSIPEICGDSVLYIDPYSKEDITKKIIELINDTALQKELVKKGAQHVQKFTWEKSALKHIEIFNNLALK